MNDRYEIYPFLNHILVGEESKAETELNLFIETHGRKAFHNLDIQLTIRLNDGTCIQSTLLWFVAYKNYLTIARKLIESGANIDDGTRSESKPEFDNQSPLMAACEQSHIEMIKLLLESAANPMHRTGYGLGMLWKVRNAEVCKLIIEYAKKHNSHLDLLTYRIPDGFTAFDFATEKENMAVYSTLISYEIIELQTRSTHSEEQALTGIERFITLCPTQLLHDKIFHATDRTKSPIYYAAKHNYLNVAKRLIKLGVTIDEGVQFEEPESTLHLASPLIVACYYGHLKMSQLLIASHANMLHTTEQGHSALMLTKTAETVQLLLAESSAKGLLPALLTMKSKTDVDAGSYQSTMLNSEAVYALMAVPDFDRMLDIEKLLIAARLASALSPEKSNDFDEICNHLRPFIKKFPPLQLDSQCTSSLSMTGAHFNLFQLNQGARSCEEVKTEAVKSIIAQYFHMLGSPDECITYLRFLNTELRRYYQCKYHEDFPVLDPKTFDFQSIGDLMYPVPASGYIGIKKHRALSELLMTIFRKHGLAEQAVKWIGFIPQIKANEMVKKGCFFTEGTFGVGLYHGKLSHMIQRILLIYAVEHGKIDLSFQFNSKRHHLGFNDIFDGLVSIETKDKKTAWSQVQDERNYNLIQFSDPHRLISTIMVEGHAKDLSTLADSLTDSFCKGIIAYYKAYKTYTPFTDIDLTRYITHMEDLTLHLFSSNQALIKAEKAALLVKRGLYSSEIDQSDDHALIPKIYEPEPSFHPRDYEPDDIKSFGELASNTFYRKQH